MASTSSPQSSHPQDLSELVGSIEVEDRIAAASNPDLTPADILTLLSDEEVEVRETLCVNAAVSIEQLKLLAADREASVRLMIARDRKMLPALLITALSLDGNKEVAQTAQEHPKYGDALNAVLLHGCGVEPNLSRETTVELLRMMVDVWAWPNGVEVCEEIHHPNN
ncbi:hypothetical protein [Leucobacter salsicius]|uniref:hypothetical protein n=1 Tax=Leucobacter salsicius TaxID=664638 RepID=UPI0003784609|nr:hypothetical protein [Leucobacter salsicius]